MLDYNDKGTILQKDVDRVICQWSYDVSLDLGAKTVQDMSEIIKCNNYDIANLVKEF